MKPGQEAGVKKALNAFTRFGFAKLPKSIYATGIWLILRYHMNMEEAVRLYNKYIGDWGGTSTTYRFEAVMVDASTRQERVVKTIIKEPMTERKISAVADHENLIDAESYDVAEVRIQAQVNMEISFRFTMNHLLLKQRDRLRSLEQRRWLYREEWAAFM